MKKISEKKTHLSSRGNNQSVAPFFPIRIPDLLEGKYTYTKRRNFFCRERKIQDHEMITCVRVCDGSLTVCLNLRLPLLLPVDECNQETRGLDQCNSSYERHYHQTHHDRLLGTHSGHFYSSGSRSLPKGLVCLSSYHILPVSSLRVDLSPQHSQDVEVLLTLVSPCCRFNSL